mmetsp:Transcript_21922/g.33159  ORF Transcript_21922/g.33159 Transcript_21922/m.33159 type:complete len:545 (-) Transcript_21922:551-2185(-)
MAKKDNDFGRNEMAALLGGVALLENLTKKTEPLAVKRQLAGDQGKDKEDFSNLTVAQTAALLKKRDLEKKKQNRSVPSRLRAQKRNHVPQHHALLMEEQQRLEQTRNSTENENGDISNGESEGEGLQEEEDFVSRALDKKGRKKVEPQIIVRRKKKDPEILSTSRRRRRRRDFSSDESSSDESIPERKEESSSSSEDDRRARVLAKRQHRLETQKKIENSKEEQRFSKRGKDHIEKGIELSSNQENAKHEQRSKIDSSSDSNTSKESNHASGDDSSSSSGSSGSSSSDDSSSDEKSAPPAIAKPLFVPRHKRQTVLSQEQKQEQESEKAAKLREQNENRKMQSRLMIAEAVAAHASSREDNQDYDDEGGGATNTMPDDTDPSDSIDLEKLRDAWEVREIQRLLESQDLRDAKAEELMEYERRRKMTDQERLREDRALGLYMKPGEQREQKEEDSHYLQRYYHRGAFFMDEEEWDEQDIRHKAKDYERAATGNDKINKRNLPKIMQVKNFGFARQNTRYKGLAHEDTSDKKVEYLPLKHNKKKRR